MLSEIKQTHADKQCMFSDKWGRGRLDSERMIGKTRGTIRLKKRKEE